MRLSSLLPSLSLGVAVAAFGLAGGLSLRAGVEPLYSVVRGMIAFGAVLLVARWSAAVLDSLSPAPTEEEPFAPGRDQSADSSPSSRR
jgi:hypothetical protein